ncbi:hypothetical protein [Haloferula sp. BvORR071]|uniref:hypothetical protein n=1 Tax=Haloferula sp. BvORR071 TaxID=1396141 RepID=UPI0022410106|nr:hypothetical protein [Haloferula sp. BvORR071]
MKQAGSIPPIEVKVSDMLQLFNSMDPSPFHERDLDDDAEEFIVSWAREHPAKTVIRIVIHLAKPPPDTADPQGLVETSLRHFFEYREGIVRRELKQLLREGRTALLIGLAFLATCHAAGTLFTPGPGTWHGILREGLAILGWVAMWHPLEILLYRWWPQLQSARLYRRLADAEVEVQIAR